ncbi:MAG: calcium/sodium antiporter [Spirochaetaceae bacterium]|jgi:cation:H+ antiporter|nr:calcium/sodium antiporter [Spirochaetaceae bacterium]
MIILWLAVFAAALALLIFSSDWFISAAEKFGIMFKIPSFVIGVVIIGIGTSLPELASSISSVVKGSSEIVVGNAIGSNITNIFLVLGVSAFVGKKFEIKFDILRSDIPFLVASAILISLMIMDGNFTTAEAIICIIVLVLYVYTSFKNGAIDQEIEVFEEKHKHNVTVLTWIILFVSPALIAVGASWTVNAIIKLSEVIGLGTEVISLTMLALGTSLPEVMVSIQAARKGNPEMAVGNVIGSNIFNTLAVMGIPALFGKLIIPEDIVINTIPIFLGATVMMVVIISDKKVYRFEGIILFAFYLFFIGHSFGFI